MTPGFYNLRTNEYISGLMPPRNHNLYITVYVGVYVPQVPQTTSDNVYVRVYDIRAT